MRIKLSPDKLNTNKVSSIILKIKKEKQIMKVENIYIACKVQIDHYLHNYKDLWQLMIKDLILYKIAKIRQLKMMSKSNLNKFKNFISKN